MIAGKFDFGFAVDWMRKDLAICLAEARQQRREAADHRDRRPVLCAGAGARRRPLGHVEPHPVAQRSEVSMAIKIDRASFRPPNVRTELKLNAINSLTLRVALAVLGVMLAGVVHAAEVTLKNAWMRPALAGAAARAYVDIASDTTLVLTGASTPVASKSVESSSSRPSAIPTSEEVVRPWRSWPARRRVSPTMATICASSASRAMSANGDPVPLTLMFKDTAGRPKSRRRPTCWCAGCCCPQQMPRIPRCDVPPHAPSGEEAAGKDPAHVARQPSAGSGTRSPSIWTIS